MTKYLLLVCLTASLQIGFSADPKPKAPAAAASKTGVISGKVSETMNSGGYTYVLVDTGKEKVWAAAPQFAVKVGDAVTVGDPMPMQKYRSKTLNREFDVVYFTGDIKVNGKASASGNASAMSGLPKDHPPIGGMPKDHPDISTLPKGHPPLSDLPAAKVQGINKVKGGHTVSEIYSSKEKLSGKSTQVRGKVVRYNPMIMGRNWVHIQDGTGAAGSNDLLVTTKDPVKVGDVVLVTGKVATNKDFGANYKYLVMIEDAQVKVE